MTRLRKMMLEELERRNYSEGTTRRYLRFVERFAQHFGKSPDKLGPDHLRSYQAYLLKELKLCPGTVENHVAALRFFFVRTLHRHEFREYLPYPKAPRKLPNILSQEEVTRLINASSSLFERTLLMVLYGTGMRRAEGGNTSAIRIQRNVCSLGGSQPPTEGREPTITPSSPRSGSSNIRLASIWDRSGSEAAMPLSWIATTNP